MSHLSTWRLGAAVSALSVLAGCADTGGGRAVTYQDVRSQGIVAGVGVESQDIVGVSDQMVRDLLATPAIMQAPRVPRIIVDSEYFSNDSGQRLDKNMIIDRLRINLQRASAGRLLFVSRESAGMVEQERELKRSGTTDVGTTGMTKAQAGADYRLRGRIMSQDARSMSSGNVERYTAMTFELIDLENSLSVWANMYEFKKGGADDAVYR